VILIAFLSVVFYGGAGPVTIGAAKEEGKQQGEGE